MKTSNRAYVRFTFSWRSDYWAGDAQKLVRFQNLMDILSYWIVLNVSGGGVG
jgi:hypothetical protein